MKEKVVDFSQFFDEMFEATVNFSEAFKEGLHGKHPFWKCWDERVDFYPKYMYPPANVYMTKDKDMIFEFALAGFNFDDVDLQFKGDYMILNIKAPEKDEDYKDRRYFKRRLKVKDVVNQKFFVPADKYDHDNVKANYKSGLLKVVVPAKESIETKEGIKVEIVKEAE